MRTTYIFILSLIVICGFAILHFSKSEKIPHYSLSMNKVRIGILSKYGINNIAININSGRILLKGKAISIYDSELFIKQNMNRLTVNYDNSTFSTDHLRIEPDNFMLLQWHSGKRKYSGSLDIFIENKKIIFINTVDTETYISSVLFSESGELIKILKNKKKEKEFVKVMETTIRSYLHHYKGRHSSDGYDFCDLTHCMSYQGGGILHKKNSRKIFPIMVTNKNVPLNAYFHSTCGGTLIKPENYWKNSINSEYFREGYDGNESTPYCKDSPHFEWISQINKKDFFNAINSEPASLLLNKKLDRITSIVLKKKHGQEVLSSALLMSKIGKHLGWSVLKSNKFEFIDTGTKYIFHGNGLGHGIGLCQWGAMNQTLKGKSYKEILDFYFPGIHIYSGRYDN